MTERNNLILIGSSYSRPANILTVIAYKSREIRAREIVTSIRIDGISVTD